MSWLVFTILAITSRATYSIATKVLSNQTPATAATQSILLTAAAAVLSILVTPFIGGLHFNNILSEWPIAALMIVSHALGNILFFKGVARLEAGTTQIAFSSILIWSVLLSVAFLGSSFSLPQSLGIMLLLAAIILAQYRRGKRTITGSIFMVIASAGLFAVFQVTSAELARTISAGAYLLLAYTGSTLLLAAMYPRQLRKDLSVIGTQALVSLWPVLFAAVTSVLYFAFAYFAYQSAPDPGVVVILLTAQVVLSVILGMIFLRERDAMGRKLAAGVLAVLAGVLIKL